jgi:hypothetical protein
MPAYISINGHTIRKNAVQGTDEPPIRIARTKSDQRPVYAHEVRIEGPSTLVYSPEKAIIRCGARLALVVPEYGDVKIVR